MGLWRWFRGLLSARRDKKRAEQESDTSNQISAANSTSLPGAQPVVPRRFRLGRESLLHPN